MRTPSDIAEHMSKAHYVCLVMSSGETKQLLYIPRRGVTQEQARQEFMSEARLLRESLGLPEGSLEVKLWL